METVEVKPEPKVEEGELLVKAVPATAVKSPWICQHCGAIMGSVHSEKVRQGLSVTRLIIFRGAIYMTENLPENFIFGKVDAGEFTCSRCGNVREWRPTPETVRWLSEHRRAVKKNRNV